MILRRQIVVLGAGGCHYGYKNHLPAHTRVRRYEVTDPTVHDSPVFEPLLDRANTNTNTEV